VQENKIKLEKQKTGMTRKQSLEKLRREIPYIKAHEEDDWDWYSH